MNHPFSFYYGKKMLAFANFTFAKKLIMLLDKSETGSFHENSKSLHGC